MEILELFRKHNIIGKVQSKRISTAPKLNPLEHRISNIEIIANPLSSPSKIDKV